MSPSALIVPRMIRGISWVAVLVALSVGAANTGLFAQFSSGVQLIEVYATVTDANGELVTGLQQSDFQVFENDRAQEISAFAAGEFPLTVALGVDRSFSMAGEPLRLAKLASQTFLRQLKPGDRSMVVAIGNSADVIAPLSHDHERQAQAVAALDAWSTTSLKDAVIIAANVVSNASCSLLSSPANLRRQPATSSFFMTPSRTAGRFAAPLPVR